MSEAGYAIELKGITKRFGTVLANDHIDLDLKYGEILALLGENGSGKTTLMNMLSGIYHPDEGSIYIGGKEVIINSPMDAQELGIGMIHQHFKLVDVFTAMENIVLGTKEKLEKPKVLKEKINELCKRFGLEMDPEKKIYDMSVSEKQTVEILKVLYRGAKILILDEPTAVLTPQETDKLFAILREMKKQGRAIIIITHKLHEVLSISDRVTILRKGRSMDTVLTKETNQRELTEHMVGRAVNLEIDRPVVKEKEVKIKVEGLSVQRPDHTMALKNVSFQLLAGEILGVVGVAGSGQKELCEALAGLMPVKEGHIYYKDKEITGKTATQIQDEKISMGFVPEDRLGMGLVSAMGMTENMLLKSYRFQPGFLMSQTEARKQAKELIEQLDIVTPGTETPVRMLSGGNVQKVLLGREITSKPDVLLTAYPVRGLDINSSYQIYDLLNEQKKKKVAILFVGEDLDVLLELADRILVLCHGEVTGIVDASSVTKEELGLMMTGVRKEESVDE